MTNVTVPGLAPKPATIDKAGTHLLAPVVDGIIHRFNDDATRAEAALAAVALLQTLKAMGTFHAPVQATAGIPRSSAGVFVPASDGQRPRASTDLARALEEELRKPAPYPGGVSGE